MAAVASIPRSRGSVSGLALIVLGAWGGLAPYAGPSFGYGFSPNRAWEYTQGRLFLSAVPGAVALIAGLGIMLTRSRGFGGFLAVIAAVGGAWFIAGGWVVQLLPASLSGSITVGTPIGTTVRQIALSNIGFFVGVGALIVFFAALALGRFSLAALKDQERLGAFLGAAPGAAGAGALAGAGYQSVQGAPAFAATQPQYAADQYASYQPTQYAADQYAVQYPSEQFAAEQYPSQYPPEHYQPTALSSDQGAMPAEAPVDTATQTQTQFPPGSAGA